MTESERIDLLFLFEYIDDQLRKIRAMTFVPRYAAFTPSLANSLNLLKEAWSPMAIRNLLSDILRESLVLQKDGDVTGNKGLKEIVDDLVDQLKDHLGSHAPRMGGSIFTIDGITFGLEVCLDHAATTSMKDKGRLEHAANIQIQLIPSAGMNIKHFKTVTGGFVFNVDGVTPHVKVINEHNGQLYREQSGFRTGRMSRAWASVRRTFGQTVGASRLTGGASGPVIFCGPYDIASV